MNIKQMVKIQCIRSGNISLNEVARRCGWDTSNFTQRLKHDNWPIEDLRKIAENAFNCALFVAFECDDQINTADSVSDMIRIQCVLSGNITLAELARRINISPSQLSHSIRRNRWRVPQLKEIASVLNCKFVIEFRPITD